MILCLVIIDTSILQVTPYIIENSKTFNMHIFAVMIPLCGFCHYRMLELIKHNRKTSGKNSGMLRVANTTVSFFAVSILVLVSLQMYALLAYNSHLIQIVIWISYGLGVTNLLFLTYHFFRWFRIN